MNSIRNRMLKTVKDKSFIINATGVTTPINSGKPYLRFRVVSGDEPTYVTFKNRTITVSANTAADVDFETLETGDVEFRGGFTDIEIPLVTYAPNGESDTAIINHIVKWYKHLNYTFDSFLKKYLVNISVTNHQTPLSVTIPTTITTIGDGSFIGFGATDGFELILHNNIKKIGVNDSPFLFGESPCTNAVLYNNIWTLGKYALCIHNTNLTTPLVIPEHIEVIPANFLYVPISDLANKMTKIIIPYRIKDIPPSCFSSEYLTSVTFQQPRGFEVTFADPGSSTGPFYYKSAKALEVITDNQSVANYDFKTDNRTTTFKHNDLSDWSTLSQPTISKTGDLLTINAVTNATYYKILSTNTVIATITDISSAIDLTEYITNAGTYTLSVRAFADNYVGSIKSETVSYTKS